jgi:tetratricopeptide (TPR) repeat protein
MAARVPALLFVLAAVMTAGASPRARGRDAPALPLLDRYARGEFDAVSSALAALPDFTPVLEALRQHGGAWMSAGGEADRARRELAAATFALEAARLGQWRAWKTIQIEGITEGGFNANWHITLWDAPALLLEWGCEQFRGRATPTPQEHLWQLAAMSVAERGEDFEFLIQYVHPPPLYLPRAIQHVLHAQQRFPAEPRFQLAYGIANEFHERAEATKAFEALEDNLDGGAEATMRLGAMAVRAGNADRALQLLKTVESRTREPWVIYLARYFSGQASELKRRDEDAIGAYRGALKTIPRAQSASVALASALFRTGQRGEASEVIDAMLAANPVPDDPWRGYADADDRFWPELIGRLHEEIRR